MGDERRGDGQQLPVLIEGQVAPLEVVDGSVFYGDVVIPILQRLGKTVIPGTAFDGVDAREGVCGDHIGISL